VAAEERAQELGQREDVLPVDDVLEDLRFDPLAVQAPNSGGSSDRSGGFARVGSR
jgi:hypothetical protein